MTALIYELDPEIVAVGMDTLSLLSNKKPFKYVDKIFPLPSLRGAICATGHLDLMIEWRAFIEMHGVLRNIFQLVPQVPRLLEMADKCCLPADATTTLYHFGYSEIEKRFGGFACEIKKNSAGNRAVEVRELQVGSLGGKPYCNIELFDKYKAVREKENVLAAMVWIIKELKTTDDALPIEDRLGIGGEVHVLQMTPVEQNIQICHRFEDYDEVFNEMISNPDLAPLAPVILSPPGESRS